MSYSAFGSVGGDNGIITLPGVKGFWYVPTVMGDSVAGGAGGSGVTLMGFVVAPLALWDGGVGGLSLNSAKTANASTKVATARAVKYAGTSSALVTKAAPAANENPIPS